MSLAFARGTAKRYQPTSSLTPRDELRSCQTGSEPSGLVAQVRRLRTRDSSITHGFSAPRTGWFRPTALGSRHTSIRLSLLTLPGDAGTWSVTVFISAGDQALKRLRDPQHWPALLRACPLHSPFIDGE